jgi:hypothetical protein
MTTEINVQFAGPEEDCRQLLERLHEVAEVGKVSGPFPSEAGDGVQLHAVVVPRQRAADPGE